MCVTAVSKQIEKKPNIQIDTFDESMSYIHNVFMAGRIYVYVHA